ncbi:MAG: LacI family DNA-binding transcriptional regulator [Victivallales bacterium]|nr:LacI family DNA-binding transcriptional regulator [Victivallales bacterium]
MIMRVTLKDIAKRANVDFTLVSKCINNVDIPIRPETRRRIEEAVRELNYHPNVMARALRFGKTNTLGLLIGPLTNEYFAHFANTVIAETKKQGYRLLISVCEAEDSPKKLITELAANQVAGILCCRFANLESDDLPVQTELSFTPESIQPAIDEARQFLQRKDCRSAVAFYIEDRWAQTLAAPQQKAFFHAYKSPQNTEKRKVLIHKILLTRPDAILCTGWRTTRMISDILDRSFPGYNPPILCWANCKGPFFQNPRIQGAILTSTIQSIRDTITSLIERIQNPKNFSYPNPIHGQFLPRTSPEFQNLIVEDFTLT